MIFRAVDIETVPDMSVFTPGEPKWVPKVHGSVVQPISAGNVIWVEDVPFPPAQAHRVVAISWVDVESSVAEVGQRIYKFAGCKTMAVWGAAAERRLLSAFRDEQVGKPATLVTWNGRTFDLPVLSMRALHHGIPWEWYYKERDVRYRYSEEGHCDLMDFLSDYGAARQMKLGDAARLIGLPGKVEGMDGSKIADLVADTAVAATVANQAKVARYCLQDTIQTAILFVRSRLHLGRLTPEGYRESLETFKVPVVKDTIDINWDRLSIGGTP